MNRQHIHFYWRFKVLLIFLVLCWGGGSLCVLNTTQFTLPFNGHLLKVLTCRIIIVEAVTG